MTGLPRERQFDVEESSYPINNCQEHWWPQYCGTFSIYSNNAAPILQNRKSKRVMVMYDAHATKPLVIDTARHLDICDNLQILKPHIKFAVLVSRQKFIGAISELELLSGSSRLWPHRSSGGGWTLQNSCKAQSWKAEQSAWVALVNYRYTDPCLLSWVSAVCDRVQKRRFCRGVSCSSGRNILSRGNGYRQSSSALQDRKWQRQKSNEFISSRTSFLKTMSLKFGGNWKYKRKKTDTRKHGQSCTSSHKIQRQQCSLALTKSESLELRSWFSLWLNAKKLTTSLALFGIKWNSRSQWGSFIHEETCLRTGRANLFVQSNLGSVNLWISFQRANNWIGHASHLFVLVLIVDIRSRARAVGLICSWHTHAARGAGPRAQTPLGKGPRRAAPPRHVPCVLPATDFRIEMAELEILFFSPRCLCAPHNTFSRAFSCDGQLDRLSTVSIWLLPRRFVVCVEKFWNFCYWWSYWIIEKCIV